MKFAPLPRRRPQAVIFDMDGLMLDTGRLAPRAWVDAAASMRIEFLDWLDREGISTAGDATAGARFARGTARPPGQPAAVTAAGAMR